MGPSRRPHRGAVWFRGLSLAGIGAFVAYTLAVVTGAPKPVLTFVFNGLMLLVPAAVWWAYVRAPARCGDPSCSLLSARPCG